jgi:hypothetical protein
MVVTGDESTRSLNDVLARHTLRFGHSDGVEFGIIEEMAAAFWRMRRAWSIEKEWMDQTAAKTGQLGITAIANAFAALAGSDKYRLLDRYEARMHRTYQRLLQTLLKLQAKPARNHDSTEIENEQTNPAEPSTPVELNQ